MGKLHVMEHPLIKHKISMLRNEATNTNAFRILAKEIAILMGYEATKNLKLKSIDITTPICDTVGEVLDGEDIAVVPILRAGLGMVDSMLTLVPTAKVGHIGLYRDPETHEPVEYYCKLPKKIEDREIFVVDPMLATGGSAIAAIDFVKKHGGKNITAMFLIAAPEGIEALKNAHPDVDIYVAAKDEKLNENAYIVPGLGDAGDRIYGTK